MKCPMDQNPVSVETIAATIAGSPIVVLPPVTLLPAGFETVDLAILNWLAGGHSAGACVDALIEMTGGVRYSARPRRRTLCALLDSRLRGNERLQAVTVLKGAITALFRQRRRRQNCPAKSARVEITSLTACMLMTVANPLAAGSEITTRLVTRECAVR